MELNNIINTDIEILDDLQNGYYIIQRLDGFKFGIDAVLLSDFAKNSSGRAIDLCSGTGIIPLLLAAKSNIRDFDAVEIQPEMAEMTRRSVSYNKLDEKIKVHCMDLNDAVNAFGKDSFDVVTVNPPYMKAGSGVANANDMKLLSRHEVKCTLEDVISVSSQLLKQRRSLFMVHRPSRLADIISLMRKYKLEPKCIRMVAPKYGDAPNLVLIQGIRNAKSELKCLPQLYVYNNDGSYTKEIDVIYGR